MGQISQDKEAENSAVKYSKSAQLSHVVVILIATCVVTSLTSLVCDVVAITKTSGTGSVEGLGKQVEGLEKQLGGIENALGGIGKQMEGLGKQLGGLGQQLEGVEEELVGLVKANTKMLITLVAQVSGSAQNLSAQINSSHSTNESTMYLIGSPSDINHNHSESKVYCPAGYYASQCYCDDDSICDGAQFTIANTSRCTAFQRLGTIGNISVVAQCKLEQGKEVQVVAEQVAFGNSIECPSEFIMDHCVMKDNWSVNRTTTFLRNIANSTLSCGWKSTNTAQHVYLSAVCTRYKC